MLETLDAILGRYSHLVAAIEAFSTLAAVVVSLALALMAQRANRTRLSASLFLSIIVHESVDPDNSPEYLTLSIINKGIMPLAIPFSFFYWKLPFRRTLALVSPLDFFSDDPYISARPYPVQIAPRSTERFYLSTGHVMRSNFRKIYHDQSLWGRCLFRLLTANVTTEDGTKCRVNIDKSIRRAIKASASKGDMGPEARE